MDFIPVTHSLPADMALFQEEYRRNPKATWILKPASRAQARRRFVGTAFPMRLFGDRSVRSVVISRMSDRALACAGIPGAVLPL